jgi:hypothetical protein
MTTRRKIALVLYVLVGLFTLYFGLTYFLRNQPRPTAVSERCDDKGEAVHDRRKSGGAPAEFRFEGDEVDIRRDAATGDVVLSKPMASWKSISTGCER